MFKTHFLQGGLSSPQEGLPPAGRVINRGRWSKKEKKLFQQAFEKYGKEWKLIAAIIGTRTVIQIRTHAQKYFQKLAKVTGGPVMSTSKKERYSGDSQLMEKMRLRKRKREASHSNKKQKITNRNRENSFETWLGSEYETDETQSDFIAKQMNSMNGKIPQEVVAAATLLLAPRLPSSISPKRVKWARSCVAQEII